MTPSLHALDLSDLGTRIGDRPVKTFADGHVGQFVASTTARIERCRQRFADFPAILMPAKGVHGSERLLTQPMATQTSQQEAALLSTGPADGTLWNPQALALAVDNYQGAARGAGDPLPTQVGSETLAVVSSGVIPYRKNTVPPVHAEAMPTFTSDQIPGLLTAAATASPNQVRSQLSALWRATLAEMPLEECFYRMMRAHEIGRGCGFDVPFGEHTGTFKVWGTARAQTDGFGNAVSPQVGTWIGTRLRAVLHTAQDELATAA
jgi:hypothetical protein